MSATPTSSGRSIRNVAMPVEHGGWAFLLEPLLLGMLLAPSLAGFFLCVFGLGIFLLYQPTQIMVKDRLKCKRFPRTVLAERFVLAYGAAVVGGLLLAFLTARAAFWPAFIVMAPFAVLQLGLVVRGKAREAITEISGALALGALAPAIVLANGGAQIPALVLWLVPACRAASSILYIRARLHRTRREDVSLTVPLIAQGVGLIVLGAGWLLHILPATAPLAMLILAGRAVYGLFLARTDIPTKQVGFQEIGFGLLTVVLVTLGHL